MPLEFERKGIDQEYMGWVMGIFALAMIFVSPMMGTFIHHFGRRWAIGLGALLTGVSFLVFAGISYIEDNTTFLILSFAMRLLQGIGTTMIQVTFLSIVASFYPSTREWLIGMLEAAMGAGITLGVFFGTALFAIGGYVFMLTVFGIIFVVMAILVPFIFPPVLDMYTNMQQSEDSGSGHDDEKSPSISEVMKEANVTTFGLLAMPSYTFPALCGGLGYFNFDFVNPILPLRLVKLGLTES